MDEKMWHKKMSIKKEGLERGLEEIRGAILEARKARVRETGATDWTPGEVVAYHMIPIMLPKDKCRVVMYYDPVKEKTLIQQEKWEEPKEEVQR